MRICFIYPKFDRFLETYPELQSYPSIAALWRYRMPPALGLQILAALTPANVEWKLIDENIENVEYSDKYDLVAISFFTPQAISAYRIADKFRSIDVKVVMGGMHPSMIPEEASLHCDALCLGEAELVWEKILQDAETGNLSAVYGPLTVPPSKWVKPKRNIFQLEKKYDWHASLVQVGRGCTKLCPYCNIPGIFGNTIRLKNIDSLIPEILELQGREFYITEDLIMFTSPEVANYTRQLFTKLSELNVKVFLTSSLIFNARQDFLEILAQGGCKCIYMTFGFDHISEGIYRSDSKMISKGIEIVNRIQDLGIRFYGAFGIGFDNNDNSISDRILDFTARAGIVTSEFFIVTPFPNTPLWKKYLAERRIYHRRWNEYNCAHVVFKPARMTDEELIGHFLRLWKEYYSNVNIAESLSCFSQQQENITKTRELGRISIKY